MAEEGLVLACHSVEEWDAHLQQANASKKVVSFSSSIFNFFPPLLSDWNFGRSFCLIFFFSSEKCKNLVITSINV